MNSINKNILQIKETPIMEIANYGRNFTKETGKVVYPAWFGEGNISTDKLIYNETINALKACLLYTSPSPRDATLSRMPSSA